MNPKLVVVGGDVKTKEVNLKLPTVIGRGRDVTLALPHPLVSRRHCEIYQKNGKLIVRDLGSLNGTFVNNEKIIGEKQIEPEQLLTIGSVTFRAIYSAELPTVETTYDPVAERETVGSSDTETGEIELPKMDSAAPDGNADLKTLEQPESNIHDDHEMARADALHADAIPAEIHEIRKGKKPASVSLSALEQLPGNDKPGASVIDQLNFGDG